MKYIIDIPKTVGMTEKVGSVHYTYFDGIQVQTIILKNDEIEELNSDYINEHFSDLQDTAYQQGLEDAWEAARKLFSTMADSDIEKAFPIEWNNGGFKALMDLQPQDAIAKMKAYEEKQNDKIEVGDTVDLKDAVSDKGGGIVTKIFDNDCCYIVWYDGSGGAWAKDTLVKTGKHIDIASILREINDEP